MNKNTPDRMTIQEAETVLSALADNKDWHKYVRWYMRTHLLWTNGDIHVLADGYRAGQLDQMYKVLKVVHDDV